MNGNLCVPLFIKRVRPLKIGKTLHPTPYTHEKLFAANPNYDDCHHNEFSPRPIVIFPVESDKKNSFPAG